jgi:hypothetical protein
VLYVEARLLGLFVSLKSCGGWEREWEWLYSKAFRLASVKTLMIDFGVGDSR